MTAFLRTRWFDALIAAAITAWSLAEVVAEDLQRPWLAALLLAIAGVSLYWRRSYPLVVGLIVIASGIAQAAAGISLHTAVARVVGIFVASWSIGAYETRPRAVLGLTLLVCGTWVAMGVDVLRGTDHSARTSRGSAP